jgi:hypothetical protein
MGLLIVPEGAGGYNAAVNFRTLQVTRSPHPIYGFRGTSARFPNVRV